MTGLRFRTLGVVVAALLILGLSAAPALAWTPPAVAAGGYHTVGLRSDGTVVAVGSNDQNQCDVGSWTNIIAVAAGGWHTVGLRSDGSVVATGHADYGRLNVGAWSDIIAIAAGGYHTVGLRSDGTVVAVGRNENGQCNVGDWSDVVGVAAGEMFTVGVKSDGSVIATGANGAGQCNVGGWTDIIAVAAAPNRTFGLKSNGTLVTTDPTFDDLTGWQTIRTIWAGDEHVLGITSAGSLIAAGSNAFHQLEVTGWSNVVSAAGGSVHTAAIRSDGSVVATGSNSDGRCDTSTWHLAEPDNGSIPGVPLTSWTASGSGSPPPAIYHVYSVHLTAGVPAHFRCAMTSEDANFGIHLYRPGTHSVLCGTDRVAWSTDDPSTKHIDYLPTQTGTFYLAVIDESGTGSYELDRVGPIGVLTAAGGPKRLTYGRPLTVTGTLLSEGLNDPVVDAPLLLQTEYGSGWTTVASTFSAGDGGFGFTAIPSANGQWRVCLGQTDALMPVATSGHAMEVVPVLSTPKLSGRIRAKSTLTFTGHVAPAHAGPIKVVFYSARRKRVRGHWTTVLTRRRTVTVSSDVMGLWRLKIKLSKADWRVRASHADAGHVLGVSAFRRVRITR